MKTKIILFIAIGISVLSCDKVEDGFSIDKCVGEYVCEIKGQTFFPNVPKERNPLPTAPTSNYPIRGTVLTVTKTGEHELTLTLKDLVMVAQVDEQGMLTIPGMDIRLENENFVMPLKATFKATIRPTVLDIIQVATGTAECTNKGETFSLSTTNTQWIEGIRK